MTTQWRATGPFVASSALFSGILEETQLLLQVYSELQGPSDSRMESARQLLLNGRLPQRSRASRKSIVGRVTRRLLSWGPPVWVLDDLAVFANQSSPLALKAALLMHVCRQDRLLYSLVQEMIVPKWRDGQHHVNSTDVQRFLDIQSSHHPEIETWSRQTRERLGSTTLSLLRDYGLLQGKAHKQIVEPIVPDEVVSHVVRLLRAEGVPEAAISAHSDWQLWLWDAERTRRILAQQTDV